MKHSLLVCLLVFPAIHSTNLVAQTDAKKTTAPAPRTASAEPTIPAGAVKSEDGSFKYTDKNGKKWTYRQTPFGVSKAEDKPVDATATPFGKSKEPAVAPKQAEAKPGDLANTKAFDEGDTIRFERPTPFGTSVWRKKKSELDATDQKILDAQKTADPQTSKKQ
jgi:hypothetical protein